MRMAGGEDKGSEYFICFQYFRIRKQGVAFPPSPVTLIRTWLIPNTSHGCIQNKRHAGIEIRRHRVQQVNKRKAAPSFLPLFLFTSSPSSLAHFPLSTFRYSIITISQTAQCTSSSSIPSINQSINLIASETATRKQNAFHYHCHRNSAHCRLCSRSGTPCYL